MKDKRTLPLNIQLFGQTSSGTNAEETEQQEETNQQGANTAGTESEAFDLPQTQAELDALIERCIKREQRKWAKAQNTAAGAQAAPQQEQNAQQQTAQQPVQQMQVNSAVERELIGEKHK